VSSSRTIDHVPDRIGPELAHLGISLHARLVWSAAVDRRGLIEQYTSYWNDGDVAGFRSMIVDGCVRHDPGSTVPVSLDDNERRFRAAHATYTGLQLRNTWMWEHETDCITVAYTMTVGVTVLAGLEVFRFADGLIAEVWNVAPNEGDWLA